MSLLEFRLNLAGIIGRDWPIYANVFGYFERGNVYESRQEIRELLTPILNEVYGYVLPNDNGLLVLESLGYVAEGKITPCGHEAIEAYRRETGQQSLVEDRREQLKSILFFVLQN